MPSRASARTAPRGLTSHRGWFPGLRVRIGAPSRTGFPVAYRPYPPILPLRGQRRSCTGFPILRPGPWGKAAPRWAEFDTRARVAQAPIGRRAGFSRRAARVGSGGGPQPFGLMWSIWLIEAR